LETFDKIKKTAIQTLEIEANAITNSINFIDNEFCNAVEAIKSSTGRLIITGIGKSAIVANKIVATLNSTGTPSIFMHAADAIHGDLGIIQQQDVVLCISNSGNSPEIEVLVPLIKQFGNTVIGMTGNIDSSLAKNSDFVINSSVEQEACPNNLAPTSSTTVQQALGDAVAVCLLSLKNFSKEEFAQYHPGGALGKKIYLKIEDLVSKHEAPIVSAEATLQDVIFEISSKRLGATAVIENEELLGVITDGDLRRMLEHKENFNTLKAKDICSKSPRTIDSKELAVNGLSIMREYSISQIAVLSNNKYIGFVHIHDLLNEGLV
jgi:arabinose-5-phosphate isomerase